MTRGTGEGEDEVRERDTRESQGHGKDRRGGEEEQVKHLPGGGHGTTPQKTQK